MRALLILPLLAAAFAGCLAAQVEPLAADAQLMAGGTALPVGAPLRWNGSGLEGARTREDVLESWTCWTEAKCDAVPACIEGGCEERPFEVVGEVGAAVLSVRWPTLPGARYDAWIEDAAGERVAVATNPYMSENGMVARLDAPAPGAYVAVISSRGPATSYEAAILLEPVAPASEPRALLPDLITLAPADLTLETPAYTGVSYVSTPVPGVAEVETALGGQGCRLDEMIERGDRRCLRFSNAVGNVGEGPLDIGLAAGSLAFVQRIHWADGSLEEHPGGAAEWHAWHAHWHNAANNEYTIHPYDNATKAVGEALSQGKKGGICFADTGIVDVGLPRMLTGGETGWNCFRPRAETTREWRMGITPGWYDSYPYILSDQYIDITGVEDGEYAVCAVTNGEGTLAESDLSNNRACTPFRLSGNAIELLEPAPYHAIPREGRM